MEFRRLGEATLWIGGPVPPGADAMTLGRLILVRKGHESSPTLIEHELVHVRQFREQGKVRFLLGYLGRYVRLRLDGWPHLAAYRRLPAEIEARWETYRNRMPTNPP